MHDLRWATCKKKSKTNATELMWMMKKCVAPSGNQTNRPCIRKMPHLLFMLFQVKNVKFQKARTTCQKPSPTLLASFSYTFLRQPNFFYYLSTMPLLFRTISLHIPIPPWGQPWPGHSPSRRRNLKYGEQVAPVCAQHTVRRDVYIVLFLHHRLPPIVLQPCSQHLYKDVTNKSNR